jgi:hypothetical protein
VEVDGAASLVLPQAENVRTWDLLLGRVFVGCSAIATDAREREYGEDETQRDDAWRAEAAMAGHGVSMAGKRISLS